MARKGKDGNDGILIPTFSDAADVQKTLAAKYKREAGKLDGLFEKSELNTVLNSLNGLTGKNFSFSVQNEITPLDSTKDEKGYMKPIRTTLVTLEVKGRGKRKAATEKVVVAAMPDGAMGVQTPDTLTQTNNAKRVSNLLEAWRAEMEAKHKIDAKKATIKKQTEQKSQRAPRPENK